MFKRIFLIVLDSVGIGAAHDAEKFDDVGTNTFMHAVESTNLEFPNLRKLGFFNLANNEKNETISETFENIIKNNSTNADMEK